MFLILAIVLVHSIVRLLLGGWLRNSVTQGSDHCKGAANQAGRCAVPFPVAPHIVNLSLNVVDTPRYGKCKRVATWCRILPRGGE